MRDKRSVKGGDCCNRECNWQSTRIAGLCEFIVRAWLLRIFRLARHERVGRGDIQGWGRDFGAGWRKVISDTAGHLGAEAKLIGQDDMRKPLGSPPPRRSFFPRARGATMGFEYRPVR